MKVAQPQEETENIALHLQMAMEVGNVAWWEMELPSGKVLFDKNKTDMIGADAKDFTLFKHFTELVHPDDYEKAMQAMRDHLSGAKETYETEYRIKDKKGDYKWFYDRGRIVEKGPNGYFKIMGVVQDVTDLRNSIARLEEKNDELERMNKFMVNRELEMIELKKQLAGLQKQLAAA